jgi:hypothetical protein
MAKNVFDAFSEEFFRELKEARSNTSAYERATKKFEEKYNGIQAFTSYDSFRKRNERKRKRS